MQIQLRHDELSRLLPSEPGLRAHCHRVSLIGREIAIQAGVAGRSMPLLEQAALLHHTPDLVMNYAALDQLLDDVCGRAMPPARRRMAMPERLASVLRGFHCFPARKGEVSDRKLAEILSLSNLLDEEIEAESIVGGAGAALWEGIEPLHGLFCPEIWSAARQACPASVVGAPKTWELPVQTSLAKDLIFLMRADSAFYIGKLASMASRDPAIAGRLIQVANSPLFGCYGSIRSVSQAIAYLGIDRSRRILAGLVTQSLFASGAVRGLWKHSVWMSQFLENAARTLGFMNPEEALLMGLVHDVGRIAILTQPGAVIHARFIERGGSPVWTERLVFGMDHSELGARLLEWWNFPDCILHAVRFHHRPAETDSLGAAALYAAEFWSETDEDLPSLRHLRHALARLDCPLNRLREFEKSDVTFAALLRVA